MTLLKTILQKAHQQLLFSSDTPLLDAEILLANSLQVSRSYLFAYPERELTTDEITFFEKSIEQRKQKMPVAFITGHQAFWSLDLAVTRDTLIPRPETELLVELVLKMNNEKKIVADLGTGSGAIALAVASERPLWEIHATDISQNALEIAKLNAEKLKLTNIFFHQGDWFFALPKEIKWDVIVSNPPYISSDDPHVKLSGYEPESALLAGENGLKDLHHLILHAKNYLKPSGTLWLEHGFQQADSIRSIFSKLGYSDINTYQDLAGLDRVTGGSH